MGDWLPRARLPTETMPQQRLLSDALVELQLHHRLQGQTAAYMTLAQPVSNACKDLRLDCHQPVIDLLLLQVTRERVRQVEIRAFRKLKQAPKHGTLIQDAVNASFASRYV